MSFSDERRDRFKPETPKGYEELSSRLESTLWINRQLLLLDREKSSLKISSLRAELTAMLNDPNFKPYLLLLDDVTKSSQKVKEQANEIRRLQSELHNRPIAEKIVYRSPEVKGESGANDRVTSRFKERSFPWFWFIIIMMIIIATYQAYHHS
jgi:hypothetical protein